MWAREEVGGDSHVLVTSALAELKSEKEVAATSVSSVFQACPRAMFSSVLGHVMGRAGSFHPVRVVSAFQLLCKAVPCLGAECVFMCLWREEAWTKDFSHLVHLNCFTPVWVGM